MPTFGIFMLMAYKMEPVNTVLPILVLLWFGFWAGKGDRLLDESHNLTQNVFSHPSKVFYVKRADMKPVIPANYLNSLTLSC